jgi:hypothetical protein
MTGRKIVLHKIATGEPERMEPLGIRRCEGKESTDGIFGI